MALSPKPDNSEIVTNSMALRRVDMTQIVRT
jgi:hypothetical protein